jgi:hypothetical protein
MVALSGTSWSEMVRRLRTKWEDIGAPAIAIYNMTFPSDKPATTSLHPESDAPKFVASETNPSSSQNSGMPSDSTSLATDASHSGGWDNSKKGSESAENPLAAQLSTGAGNVRQAGGAFDVSRGKQTASSDPFTYIQDRLRQLGATYYLLESWGNDQLLYRFYCKVCVGGNANYTRYFEATNVDPLQAMGQVLKQVETWRDGNDARAQTSEAAAFQ